MTHRASCRLPTKPSKLIELALDDLTKAERSTRYAVAMGSWHEPARVTPSYNPRTCKVGPEKISPCEVCLAGSVMAFSLNAPATADIDPFSYPAAVRDTLLALDNFRSGNVGEALRQLKVSAAELAAADEAFGHVQENDWEYAITPVVDYSGRNRTKFKKQMRDMAKKLASIGL